MNFRDCFAVLHRIVSVTEAEAGGVIGVNTIVRTEKPKVLSRGRGS